jgi:ABC-2 type transport system ATP-binding protein
MRLESVGRRYGLRRPWVLREVSLEAPAGRLIRVEGRNGSGKPVTGLGRPFCRAAS